MPDLSDLRAAIDELADETRPVPVPHRMPATGHSRAWLLAATAAVAVAAVAVLVPVLTHGSDPAANDPRPTAPVTSAPPTSRATSAVSNVGCRAAGLSARQCAWALGLAHSQAAALEPSSQPTEAGWPAAVESVTVGVQPRSEVQPLTEPTCTSSHVLTVVLSGHFAITIDGLLMPSTAPRPSALRVADELSGVVVQADAATGRACQVSVFRGLDPALPNQHLVYSAQPALVSGRLVTVGGPAPGAPHGVPGRIEVVDAAGRTVVTVAAGPDGTFSTALVPGRYTLTGQSPEVSSSGRPLMCRADGVQALHAGANTVEVACQIS